MYDAHAICALSLRGVDRVAWHWQSDQCRFLYEYFKVIFRFDQRADCVHQA